MSTTHKIPRTGIGIIILKEGKILLGKRLGAHGEGEFSLPGGHLEHLESFEACATREVFEETGLKIKNIQFVSLTNIRSFAPKHYVNISFSCEWQSGIPTVREPDKCVSWQWYDFDSLPSPLFLPTKVAIHNYLKQIHYGDAEEVERVFEQISF